MELLQVEVLSVWNDVSGPFRYNMCEFGSKFVYINSYYLEFYQNYNHPR